MSKYLANRTLLLALAVMAPACGGTAELGSEPEQSSAPADSPDRRGDLVRTLEKDPSDSLAWAELQKLDEQADIEFGLLLEIEAVDGHEVRFFEPSPGKLLVLEKYTEEQMARSPRPTNPANDGPATLSQVWARVAGDAPLPPLLAEAEARQVRWVSEAEGRALEAVDREPEEDVYADPPAAGTPDPRERTHPAEGAIEKHVTSDGNHFSGAQNGCALTSQPRVKEWCWRNVTGPWQTSFKNITGHSSALAMYGGNLMTWRTRFDDSLHFTTVRPGEFWSWQGISGTTCVLPGVCWMHDGYWNLELQNADLNVDLWHWGGSFSDAGWPGPALPVYHPEL